MLHCKDITASKILTDCIKKLLMIIISKQRLWHVPTKKMQPNMLTKLTIWLYMYLACEQALCGQGSGRATSSTSTPLELVGYTLPQSDFIQSVTLTTASQKDYYKNFKIHLKYCLSALVIVFTSHSQSSSARPICETFFLSIHWSKRFWTLDPTPTILYRPWSVIPRILNKKCTK